MFKVSNSKVKLWRRCRYAAHLKYVDKLRRRMKSRPLEFGTLVHGMLEDYINGNDPFQRTSSLVLTPQQLEEYGDIADDARLIMTEYFEHWGDALDFVRMKGRSAEHHFEVEISKGILCTGKIDALAVTENKLRWLMEHKTFKSMPNEDELWRNLQSSLYIRINNILGFKPLDGTLWDYIHSKRPALPKMKKSGGMSRKRLNTLPTALEEYFEKTGQQWGPVQEKMVEDAKANRRHYFRRIFTPLKKDVVDQVFSGFVETAIEMRDALGKSKARCIDRHCSFCDYEPICRAELTGGDVDYVKEVEYESAAKKADAEDAACFVHKA